LLNKVRYTSLASFSSSRIKTRLSISAELKLDAASIVDVVPPPDDVEDPESEQPARNKVESSNTENIDFMIFAPRYIRYI
jgi:hypothetical protein